MGDCDFCQTFSWLPLSPRLLYSYHELVRRNYMKEFDSINQHELEEHMTDGEFLMRLNMTKVRIAAVVGDMNSRLWHVYMTDWPSA